MDISDLDDLLQEALEQQASRHPRVKRKTNIESPAQDYARRLAEKALYRKLINETNIAQDGIRFIFWFGKMGDFTLDQWREIIDREMRNASNHNALLARSGSAVAADPPSEAQRGVAGETAP